MTFFMIGGIVTVFTGVILVLVYLIATRMGEENSLAAKIIIWVGMLCGVAGTSLLTIEYSFPRLSHPERYSSSETTSEVDPEPPFTDYVTTCVIAQFAIDHEECTILSINTVELSEYYLTDVYYRQDYDNNIYETKYISAVNDNNELVIKEITL